MSLSKYINSKFGFDDVKEIFELGKSVTDRITGKTPCSFHETANKGEFAGDTFEGWILKLQTGVTTARGQYADEIIHRTNIFFLEKDGNLYLCKKEKKEHEVFAGNKMVNEFLSFKEKETIDIDLVDPKDLLVEFDFAGRDIDGKDFDVNSPLYDQKGIGIRKALKICLIRKCMEAGEYMIKFYKVDDEVVIGGEKGTEFIPNITDGTHEKHVPVISQAGETVTVQIGSTLHPMQEAHYIEFIALETATGYQKKDLKPGDQPIATFAVTEPVVAAYEYCNLHGLWRTEA